ncbi:SigE family RNA polymerase sigma factor [Micromonospora sp. NPDC003197]
MTAFQGHGGQGEATGVAARHAMEEEFHDFVVARSAALLRTAYLLAGDWATAEDLLQTALTKTYLAWKRLGEIEAVEPYARRVLVNTATSWWRRRWHGERPTERLPESAGPDRIEEQLERDALWRHVRALPVRQRAVLVLRFYEDLSEAQTAAMLNISVGTVKSQTARALKTLRQRIGDGSTDGIISSGGIRQAASADSSPTSRPALSSTGRAATPTPAPQPASGERPLTAGGRLPSARTPMRPRPANPAPAPALPAAGLETR